MARMTAMQAAIRVLESEGVKVVFGIPGAAILRFYEAFEASRIKHCVVRHEEAGTPYIAAYRVAASPIDILAVIHTARHWPSTFD